MPPDRWHQHNITFADRATAQRAIAERLGPTLLAAQEAAQLTGWWFMNKQPWPLRYRAATPSPLVDSLLSELVVDGTVRSWTYGVYEPETTAFGGTAAMEAAHDLFHQDSRHLLTYEPRPGRLGRRESAVLLFSLLMRAAHLDWFEQGDVWAKAALLRPAAEALTPERTAALIPAMRTLMTVDARSLSRTDGPLDGHAEWVAAFEQAGTTLAHLATGGGLSRGLRAVIAHHVIFHANRAGLRPDDQSALFSIAREASQC
ncbi:protein-L-isoaspartate(D-aspartate) O-methyltransferase [Streptomyces sp. 3213]|nr:protein-L-isoaspartate(D-aspartate) O-methyltransferase [Streptomyces sp. 3213] [Streptomyces sp. 3213.3]